jgi:hypothetical protein
VVKNRVRLSAAVKATVGAGVKALEAGNTPICATDRSLKNIGTWRFTVLLLDRLAFWTGESSAGNQ